MNYGHRMESLAPADGLGLLRVRGLVVAPFSDNGGSGGLESGNYFCARELTMMLTDPAGAAMGSSSVSIHLLGAALGSPSVPPRRLGAALGSSSVSIRWLGAASVSIYLLGFVVCFNLSPGVRGVV
jgi:hypothetical protein